MDCNNFYASCERIFRPDLLNRPIVVLSNNDGCIVARSAEAKALGIPMGAVEFKYRDMLKQHNVEVFSSNYALYGDISQRVMQVAESVTPYVEQYSIDEAFLPLTKALEVQAHCVAKTLRQRVSQWTCINVSIGIGPTKTLAKLANFIAKKQNGIFIYPTDKQAQDALLNSIAVHEVWGIGRRHAAKLRSFGVYTAKDLRDKDNLWLKQQLTVTGLNTAMELRGMPCINHAHDIRHTLVSSRSFGERVYEKEHLNQALCTFTARAAQRLRREELLTKGIAVHICSSKHQPCRQQSSDQQGQEYYNKTKYISFPYPTSNTQVLIQAVNRALQASFKEGVAYAKAGVMLYDICSSHSYQGSLLIFAEQELSHKRNQKLMATIDAIHLRFGRKSLQFASQGLDSKAPWHMRQKHLSPKFTSDWNQLPIAFCR